MEMRLQLDLEERLYHDDVGLVCGFRTRMLEGPEDSESRLNSQSPPRKCQRAVDHYLLAKGGGDDVVAVGEGFEDAVGDTFSQRVEQQFFTHQ